MPCSAVLSRYVGIDHSWRNQDYSSRHLRESSAKNNGNHSKNNRVGGTDAVLLCIEAFEESVTSVVVQQTIGNVDQEFGKKLSLYVRSILCL